MKKILCILSLAVILLASVKVPMDPRVMTTDNGGLKDAASAYQDGVGIVVSGDLEQVDNKSYNDLVIKYGEEAEQANEPLVQYLENKADLPEVDQIKLDGLNSLEPIVSLNGSSCNDGDLNTVQDLYDDNNVCAGITPAQYCLNNGFDGIEGLNCYNWEYSAKILNTANYSTATISQTSYWKSNQTGTKCAYAGCGTVSQGTKCLDSNYLYVNRGTYYPPWYSTCVGNDSTSCPSGMVYKDSLCRKTKALVDFETCDTGYYYSSGACYAMNTLHCPSEFEEYGSSTDCRKKNVDHTPLPN